jgi:hypothetical protein
MPGFNGTGPNGMGPMTGGGRGFCGPRGIGMRNYAFPRWSSYYTYPYYGAYGFRRSVPWMSREHTVDFLKGQAEALRNELRQLEDEIEKLSAEKSDV